MVYAFDVVDGGYCAVFSGHLRAPFLECRIPTHRKLYFPDLFLPLGKYAELFGRILLEILSG